MRILMLDLDTLRPDHLGCYGYHRDTSPTLDAIARDGVRFDNYHCSDAPCLPSRAALLTGRFGIHNGAVGHAGTAGDLCLTGAGRGFQDPILQNGLFYQFRKAGMHTASVNSFAERHSSYWFNAGFHEVINCGGCGGEGAETVTPLAMDWLQRNAEKDNWFLHVNYWDPHTPYRAPASFGNPFANDPLPAWLTPQVLEEHKKHVGPHSINELNMYNDQTNPKLPRQLGRAENMQQLHAVIDGYDCGIRFMDDCIGQLISYLKQAGLYDDTAIIVTSDHGENMGELGIYCEHATADEITTRVPMIIKWPGAQAGTVDTALHYNLDLVPTIAQLLNLPAYEKWDGASYAAALQGGESCGRPYLVVSQCAHVCQRAVRFGDYLYIRTYHDGYHLFDNEMLFDIKNDFHEQYNLASKRPDLCGQACRYLIEWQQQMMLSGERNVDPLWTVIREGGPFHAKGQLPAYCQRLQATGREEGARLLRKKHPQEFFEKSSR